MSNVLNALGAFERVDEVERTEVFGESFANRLRGSLCVAEVGSDDFEASLASGEVPVLVSVVRRASVYVALTYIPFLHASFIFCFGS